MAFSMNRYIGSAAALMATVPPSGLSPNAPAIPSRSVDVPDPFSPTKKLVAKGSQFIIATHSPILMAYPGATIYSFGSEAPHPVEFLDTEHYQVTRAFLDNPERMLHELVDGADTPPTRVRPQRGDS